MENGDLLLVTSANCHLCEHARAVVSRLGLAAREVDVESAEAAALARDGIPLAFLPVLVEGRHVLGYGRLSERALRKRLAA